MNYHYIFGALITGAVLTAPAISDTSDAALRALLHLPDHVELPRVPEINPITAEKIALGRALFYDTRLSGNETQSCSSCHAQDRAFSDALTVPIGSTGHVLPRNSQALFNLGYLPQYTWASTALTTLEAQIHIPIRADIPVELGVNDANASEILTRFADDTTYASMFNAAFPDSDTGPSFNKITMALASFLRTMNSFGSPVDQFLSGDLTALNAEEQRGLALFNGEKFECFHCHSGPNLTTAYVDGSMAEDVQPFMFFSNGLYNVGGNGSYPAGNQGLFEETFNPRHRGLFRAPSLRNIALTAPYMHDGSIATLEGVIDHYAAGGTVTRDGPLAGDGRTNPNRSPFVRGFDASEQERAALLAFLLALTDEEFTQRNDLGPP